MVGDGCRANDFLFMQGAAGHSVGSGYLLQDGKTAGVGKHAGNGMKLLIRKLGVFAHARHDGLILQAGCGCYAREVTASLQTRRRLLLDDGAQTQGLLPHWDIVKLLTEIWKMSADEWHAGKPNILSAGVELT